MSKILRIRWIIPAVVSVLFAPAALAAACNSNATGNWATIATWSCGHVPLASDDVTIAAGHTITMNGNPGSALSLTINGTATWTQARTTNIGLGGALINAGGNITGAASGILTSTGGLTINAILTSTTVTVILQTTAAQTISGTGSLARLTVNNPVVATSNGNLTVGTALSGTGTLTTTGTLNIGGASAITTLIANAVGNSVNYSGAAQTVKLPTGGNYYHLTLSGSGNKSPATGTYNILGNFTVNLGTTWLGTAPAPDPAVNISGNLIINGVFTAGNGAYSLAGNFTNSGTFTSGTGVFTFSGNALQTLTGATTFTNMAINNTGAGLQLANDITASINATTGSLTLTAGVVTTGANTLIVPRNCNASITRTGGHVAGNLRLLFPIGAPSCTFHIGDAVNYRPINVSFASVTTAGSLTGTVSQTAGDHPNLATSGLDSGKSVNRYWALSNPTGGTIAYTTYTATFNFINPSDIDAGATATSFEVERWDGTAWNSTTLGTAGATSTSASGLPFIPVSASHGFAVGEKKGPYVVSINLASPDPTSPATVVDWTVTFSASVTGVDVSDFALVPGGSVSGASISSVTGSGTTWAVTANTGTGAGMLGLNLIDDDTIVNAVLKPLGGTGTGNGNFTGQIYTIVYTAAGFVFTDNPCVHNIAFGAPGQTCAQYLWSPQLAGQNSVGAYITVVDASGVPTRLHASQVRTRNMEFGLSCHNPTANAGVQATFAGTALPLCQANGATPTAWSSPVVTVTFPGGSPSSNVSYTFNYTDVGSVALWTRNNAIPSETGTSGAFVVKPAGFVLSGIQQTAAPNLANPAAANAAGAKFVKAGEAFSVTVTAVTTNGAATPNYGKEITPESVKLTSTLAGGLGLTNNPAITGTFGTFVNGAATGTAFSWNEVGIITITPSVGDGSYLGAGDVTGSATSNVGRFHAAQFALSGGYIANRTGLGGTCALAGCDTFTYMGEQMSALFTLTAKAADGSTTLQNYNYSATAVNNFAKLSPAAAGNPLALAAVDTGTPRTVAILDTSTYGVASGSFANGVAAIAVPFTVTRGASPSGPFDALDIGVAPVDSDGAALAVLDLAVNISGTPNTHCKFGSTKARFGRLKIASAHGSELLPLPITVTAQCWNGSSYLTNPLDNSSKFAPADVLLTNHQKNLAMGETSVMMPPAEIMFANGIAGYRLSKPGAGNNGSVDMAVNILSGYLPSNTARATFGVYKGSNEIIFLRENY